MKSIKFAILYGFLLWLIPFIVSFLVYPVREINYPFFETIMPIALAACVVVFGTLYMKDVDRSHIAEGLKIGVLWFIMSVVIDLFIFMWGPMKKTFPDYMTDIGLTYLIYPIVTVGFGLILKKK